MWSAFIKNEVFRRELVFDTEEQIISSSLNNIYINMVAAMYVKI